MNNINFDPVFTDLSFDRVGEAIVLLRKVTQGSSKENKVIALLALWNELMEDRLAITPADYEKGREYIRNEIYDIIK